MKMVFNPPYDGHVHSNHSGDGLLTIDQLAHIASYETDLGGFILTDHDTVSGLKYSPIIENKYPIKIIPGAEITTNINIKNKNVQFEIKAIYINSSDELLETVLLYTSYQRVIRIKQMIDRINKEYRNKKGFIQIRFSELLTDRQWNEYYNYRIQQQDNLKKKAAILNRKFHEEIDADILTTAELFSLGRNNVAKLMVDHRLVNKKNEAFEYALNPTKEGQPGNCYVERKTLSLELVIKAVKSAGGVCGPCHPGMIVKQYEKKGINQENVYKTFLPLFEDGIFPFIESEYEYCKTNKLGITPTEKNSYNKFWKKVAKEHNLIECNGSDTHGFVGGTALGELTTSYENILRLEEIARQQRNIQEKSNEK